MGFSSRSRRRLKARPVVRPFRPSVDVLEARNLPSLVAAYSFAEGSGTTAADASGSGNTGTLSNATWVQGKYGTAVKVTGANNSSVNISDSSSIDLTKTLTLEAWVNPSTLANSASGWVAAVAKDNKASTANDIAYALYAANGTGTPPALHLLVGGKDVGVQGTSVLPLNTWTFLTGTYDGSTMRLYVNGTLVASKSVTGTITVTHDPLHVGGDWDSEMFTGTIDEVRVYNTTLTQAQIQSDMNSPISSLALTPTTLPADTINVPYNQSITTTGGVGTVNLAVSNVKNAIAGLTVPGSGTNTLSVSGTPTAAGTETFTVTATDQSGATATGNYSVTVNAAPGLNPSSLPATTEGVSYNQTISAMNGTGNVSLAVTNLQNLISGLQIPTSGTNALAIGGTPSGSGTVTFTVTPTDSLGGQGTPVNYAITVNPSITIAPPTLPSGTEGAAYSQTITASNGTGNISLAVSNILGSVPGLTIPSSGTNSITIQGTPTGSGTITFNLSATDAVGAGAGPVSYTLVVNPALTVNPSGLAADTINIPYSQTITTSNGTGTVNLVVSNVQNAIAGLTVPGSGTNALAISGTPTTTGTETFTVTATDQAGNTATANYSITVNAAITISPPSLAAGTAQSLFKQTLRASGGTGIVTLAVSNIQNPIPGLIVPSSDTTELNIGGTPTAAGTETFTVTATDEVGAATTINYSVTINPAVVVTPATLPTGTVNDPYSFMFTASGGSGTGYSFSEVGALPSGMTLSSGGVLGGTPMQSGTFNITVTATDGNDGYGSQAFTLTVNPAVLPAPAALASATLNTPYSVPFTATGGSGSGFTFAESGALPTGMTFTSAGLLSGTPTQSGTFNITVTATDSNGGTGSITDTLIVGTGSAPTVAITSPTGNSQDAGSITISATAYSSVGVRNVQFAVDGSNVGSAVTTAPYQVTWDSTKTADGSHAIRATVTDNNGNTATSSITVQVVNGGVFGPVINMPDNPVTGDPVVPVNMVLMDDGSILFWDGGPNCLGAISPTMWNPETGVFTAVPLELQQEVRDIFCSDMTVLANGDIVVAGGHDCTSTTYIGTNIANLFDPSTGKWTFLPNMNDRRWYPNALTLPDGRVLVTAGAATSNTNYDPIPEVYDPVANTWTKLTNANLTIPDYPFMFVLPNGNVLAAGSDESAMATYELNVATQTWTTVNSTVLDAGSAVQYLPGMIMKAGSSYISSDPDNGGSVPSSANTYVINMNQANPTWQQTESMANPRTHLNLTILPDDTVLATGGSTDIGGVNPAHAVYQAELWSPVTQTWTKMASEQVPRLYHSTALLLPTGQVVVAGGGRNFYNNIAYPNAEIYSPAYLFKGPRPTITQAPPTNLGYNQGFFVGTPDAADVASVALIRNGSDTHAFNTDQSYIPLTFTQTSGGLLVQSPANDDLAVPGYYMLFIVNKNGVPAVAPMVRLPAPYEDTTPPTAPTNLTATSGLTGSVNLTWTAATDNVGVTQYNVYRSTTSGFTPSAANEVGTSTTTAYTDYVPAGTYYYLVTAQDAAGNVSQPSNQASGTSQPDTIPPTVSMTSPAAGTIVSGTVAVAANASDNVAVASVQFILDGNNYGSPVTSAPYSISWNSATVANGTHTWAALATDTSGNTSTSATDSFTVNNSALPGEVASYSLDEGTGTTVNDSSTNGNQGTANGATWTTGYYGNALKFSGASNSMVTVPNSSSLALTTGLTLEAWVNPSTLANSASSGWVAAVAKDNTKSSANDIAYALYAANGTGTPPALHLLIGGKDVGVQGTSVLPLNTWTFLTGTYDGSTMRLYVNGTLVASKAKTGNLTTTTDPLHIGGDWDSETFTGTIDNVRVYNRALSASEITSDMNTPISARPLHAEAAPAGGGGQPLTQALLDGVVNQAIASWAAAGVSPDQLQVLDDVHLEVRDLPSPYLGLTSGNQIWISRDAQGYGWFTDPGDNQAFASGQVHGMDLLTTVVHEFGHVLNLERDDSYSAMAEWLPPATRREPLLPGATQTAAGPGLSVQTGQAAVDQEGSVSGLLGEAQAGLPLFPLPSPLGLPGFGDAAAVPPTPPDGFTASSSSQASSSQQPSEAGSKLGPTRVLLTAWDSASFPPEIATPAVKNGDLYPALVPLLAAPAKDGEGSEAPAFPLPDRKDPLADALDQAFSALGRDLTDEGLPEE